MSSNDGYYYWWVLLIYYVVHGSSLCLTHCLINITYVTYCNYNILLIRLDFYTILKSWRKMNLDNVTRMAFQETVKSFQSFFVVLKLKMWLTLLASYNDFCCLSCLLYKRRLGILWIAGRKHLQQKLLNFTKSRLARRGKQPKWWTPI